MRPTNRIDGAAGAMGEKIEPNGGFLAEEPCPHIFCRGREALPRCVMPPGERFGGMAFLDALGASAQVGALDADSKAAIGAVLIEQR